jgi:magnesium-transporting ATPase (P-type)
MRRPPRPAGERLLTWPLAARAYLWLGLLQAAASMTVFFFVLRGGGWEYGDVLGKPDPLYLQATTACLAAIVVAQVVNAFLCRHPRESALRYSLVDNPLLLAGIGLEIALILVIVYTPLGNAAFGTRPLTAEPWLVMIALALAIGALEELRKALLRRRG